MRRYLNSKLTLETGKFALYLAVPVSLVVVFFSFPQLTDTIAGRYQINYPPEGERPPSTMEGMLEYDRKRRERRAADKA